MKWATHKANHGDVRTRRIFSLFPISDGKTTRWLEWVIVKEIYYSAFFGSWLRTGEFVDE